VIKDIAAAACKLHDQGKLTDEQLIEMLEQCVNATALENGYAEKHGLPFKRAEKGSTR
jgi:hypothetical protein